MARLTDAEILEKFRKVLSQWQFTGYVTWKPIARQWLEQNLEGLTSRLVAEEMFQFFAAGGQIDQVRETRPHGANTGSTTISAWKSEVVCCTSRQSSSRTIQTIQPFTW